MTHLAVVHSISAPASASLHALGGDFALAVWESTREPGSRVIPMSGDAEVRPPYTTLTVRTAWGAFRSLAFLRNPPRGAGQTTFASKGEVVAVAGTRALSDIDLGLLVGGLDSASKHRVVRFFLDFVRSVPALKSSAGFVSACRSLVAELSPEPSAMEPIADLADGLVLCRGSLSGGFGDILGTLVLTPESVITMSFDPHVEKSSGRGRTRLHAVIGRRFCTQGVLLVIVGKTGLACRTLGSAGDRLPAILEALASGKSVPQGLRHHVLRCLEGHRDEVAASALREIQMLSPLPKKRAADPKMPVGAALEVAVPTSDGGIFVSGWVHDPHNLVRSLSVATHAENYKAVEFTSWRFPHKEPPSIYGSASQRLSGFAAYVPGRPSHGYASQVVGKITLGSGSVIDLAASPRSVLGADARAAVLGCVPPSYATPEMIKAVIAPAVLALHAEHMKTRRSPEVIRFGRQPQSPAVSVIVPLYKNLEFLRFQLSAFATDRDFRQAEIIFVLDSPEQRDEVEHFLTGLHRLYELPMTLVVQSDNYGYSAANNAGAEFATAPRILFLNSDVIPDTHGWLSALAASLDAASPGTAAVGPKLLFDDHSLQHAGLYFDRDHKGRWFNHHYYKGMPRDFGPACRERSVPGVTGACLMMRSEVFREIGGFCEDYVIGDFEDSDLCLRVREAGYGIRYIPSVELFHLERRSISKHVGYTRGVASEYNRWLHAAKWGDAMSDLMSRDWEVCRVADAHDAEDSAPVCSAVAEVSMESDISVEAIVDWCGSKGREESACEADIGLIGGASSTSFPARTEMDATSPPSNPRQSLFSRMLGKRRSS